MATVFLSLPVSVGFAQETGEFQEEDSTLRLSPPELFAFADGARDRGDFEVAEKAYRALAENRDIELRTEARFRLAMMLHDRFGQKREAAVLLRRILDEKPDASRVRVELARIQAELGHMIAAERELRAAQASGLPPEVERMVEFYASALNAQRPYGFSAEIALAPDNNINRATRSDTLGTIIGNFELSDDARAQSGVGLMTRGQVWGRLPLARSLDFRMELNGNGNFYRSGQFNDYALGLEAGPRWRSGRDALALSGIVQSRWYGGSPYTLLYGAQASLRHPVHRRSQIQFEIGALHREDRFDAARDAGIYNMTLGLDRALSSRSGTALRISGQRSIARDPGYSTRTGGISVYYYREASGITIVGSAGYSHLEADRRIFLYPETRADNRLDLGLSATLRSLRLGSFAPVVGVAFERNWSTIEIYDYRRLSTRFGITAAF